jgi:hypothetical protein
VTLGELRNLGGHIVGQVDIVNCVTESDSTWFQGKYGFVLRNPVAFDKPWPCKGALGLFNENAPGDAQDVTTEGNKS